MSFYYYYMVSLFVNPTWVNHPQLGVMQLSVPGKWVGYQSWLLDSYHDLSFFQRSQVFFMLLMNGCPDTLWAAANCRAKRGEGA